MNPQERSREFREKLRQRNPKQARRYEAYFEKKKEFLTAEYGYKVFAFEEITNTVEALLEERGYRDRIKDDEIFGRACKKVAEAWGCYLNFLKERVDSGRVFSNISKSVFENIGLRSITDFVEAYLRCDEKTGGKGYDYFDQFLINTAANADEELREYISNPDGRLLSSLFIVGHEPVTEIDCGSGPKINVAKDEYYREQYRRLERENNLHTREAENVFLPMLKAIYKADWTDILSLAETETPLTFEEVKEAVERAGSPELQSIVNSKEYFFLEHNKFVDNPLAIFMVPDEGTLAEQIAESMADSVISSKGSGLFDELKKLISWKSRNVDEGEAEKRIRKQVKEAEEMAMDASPETALRIREHFTEKRFALYLFNLARRRRDDVGWTDDKSLK